MDFIYLGFDYLGMGESPALPGEFKQSRYMFRLIENTWDAVSYLVTLPFVEEIHGLGVCQGGSIIASAAVTDHRIKKIAMVSGMMAADAFQWTDRDMANQMIAGANASMQKQYETGEPDYVAPFGLNDEMSREEFTAAAAYPAMAGETYDYYGRDGVKGPVAVANLHQYAHRRSGHAVTVLDLRSLCRQDRAAVTDHLRHLCFDGDLLNRIR